MTQETQRLTARFGYQPHWSWSFLRPKYWINWLGIFALVLLAFIPYRLRDKFAAFLGKIVAKKAQKQRLRAEVNLSYCFPDKDKVWYDGVIEQMFITATQVMLGIGEIALRSKKHLQKRSRFMGLEHIIAARNAGKNIILMVPHGWAIDASGIILHTQGMPMTSMYNPHRNPLIDWLWTKVRVRFGGKMHARQNGIKPFLTAIKNGEVGYYLPDEDYGEALSVYTDFFATYKATLPGLNKMAKLAKATVIPMFPRYRADLGYYEMEIRPEMSLNDDPILSARAMNREIEYFVGRTPEQYVWILKLLKTRQDGENIYRE